MKRFVKASPRAITSFLLASTMIVSQVPIMQTQVLGAESKQVYEAEDAKLDGVIIDTKHSGYTGSSFTDFNPNAPGGTIEWTVNVPSDGQYSLVFRYGHGGNDERNSQIKVNGEVVEDALAFPPTGEWNNWQNSSTVANLKAGQNTIIATGVSASGGANIDSLTIEPIVDVTYEAEDATFEGVVTDTKHSGYTGTAFTDYNPNVPGGYIEWKVNVPTDDTYALQFRYGNGGSDSRPVSISVNGEMKVENLDFSPTGEWNNWTISSTNVELKAGENIILATATGASGGANIDNLRVTSLSLLDNKADDEIVMNEVEVSEIIYPILADKLDRTGLLVKNIVSGSTTVNDSVKIKSFDVVDSNIILITLDSYFEKFDAYDIMAKMPTTTWEALDPKLKNMQIKQMAVGQNMDGNTVLVYQLKDDLNKNGGITIEEPTKTFNGDLEAATQRALNMTTMQLENGGWYKNNDKAYDQPWDGKSERAGWISPTGEELGTIDNNATISEMKYIAEVYRENPLPELEESLQKGLNFLFDCQYETGGFAQVYPRRGTDENPSYSDFVTFNDNAMINVLKFYDEILDKKYPFDKIEISDDTLANIKKSKADAIDYILKAQIEVDGELTAWCAQHDPYTYEAQYARAYEHPSISGMESVGIIKYLMDQEQTPEIQKSVESGLKWYEDVKVPDTRYASGDPEGIYFYESKGDDMWYRFYEIGTNEPIFSGRDGVITHNLLDVEEERRNGYSWAGDYASQLLDVVNTTGYYEDKIYAEVVANNSTDANDKTLEVGQIEVNKNQIPVLGSEPVVLNVSADGYRQFKTIQSAIDYVPENNVYPVIINVSDGVYNEVINIPTNKPNITLVGQSKEKTIITYNNYAGKDNGKGGTLGSAGCATAFIYGNDFKAQNITFENSFDETSIDDKGKQALAINAKGERQQFINCNFLGNQDTVYTNDGTQYFNNCYIEGDVDFIFGASQAVFENCELYSYDRGTTENNGYITAASTNVNDEFGYLFLNCKLTSDAPEGSVYLGRPWHPSGDVNAVAHVVFMNCELGAHINPDGWTKMSGFEPEGHLFYEYKNTGAGAIDHARGRQLTDEQAQKYTVENVLGGWNPNK